MHVDHTSKTQRKKAQWKISEEKQKMGYAHGEVRTEVLFETGWKEIGRILTNGVKLTKGSTR